MKIDKSIFKKALEKYLISNNYQSFYLKGALIDMDGILYDSMPKHTAAWLKLSKELGLECSQDEFYLYEGMTGYATINLLFNRAYNKSISREEAAELYKKKAKYFIESGTPDLMDHTLDILSYLKSINVDRVIVTGSAQDSILERVQLDYPNIFDNNKRITAHDVIHGKPNPEPYLKGLEKANIKPNEAIVIENAPLGVKAGHAAGCFTIAVTTGPIPEKDLWDSGADFIFPSMKTFDQNIVTLVEVLRDT